MSEPPKDMSLLPIGQQDALATRYQTRVDVREAMRQLAAALKAWLADDTPDYERFNALGHQAQYTEWPTQTLARQLQILGFTPQQIRRMRGTPLDRMSTAELLMVLDRITQMLNFFASTPEGGKFEDACDYYIGLGQLVRQKVIEQTGHAPEYFIPERAKITGDESPKRFKAGDLYRPTLF